MFQAIPLRPIFRSPSRLQWIADSSNADVEFTVVYQRLLPVGFDVGSCGSTHKMLDVPRIWEISTCPSRFLSSFALILSYLSKSLAIVLA